MGALERWSTHQVAAPARFDAWCEKLRALHLDWDVATTADAACEASIRYRREGDVQVADFSGAGFTGSRDPNRDTADVIGIQLTLGGRQSCDYGDRKAIALGSEDLFLWGSGLGRAFDSIDGHHEFTVIVPRNRVPRSVESWLHESQALTTTSGTGLLSMAADQMRGIAREMENLSSQSLIVSVDVLLDTLDAAVAPLQGVGDVERSALLEQVQDFIMERLGDSGLTVNHIAAAHAVSVRTLHTTFAATGTSVGRWVRIQRLEQCRRELTRAPVGTTVTDVAFRWGFVDAAHFSRAFKQEFGMTPSSVLARPELHRV
jgi:AraC-like DNA-binding protein